LVQIVTETGIIDVLIHFGGHLEDDEARRIVTRAASGAIVGRTDRAGKTEVKGGADTPTEAAFDVALCRQRQGAGYELIVREPTARGFGEKRGESRAVELMQGVGMGHKGVEIKGRELLVGKG